MLKTLNSPRSTTKSQFLSRAAVLAAVLLLAVWAGINWFQSIATIIRLHEPLPFEDYWAVIEHLRQYQTFDFSVLWQPHNEHRIVFPEIVFACDVLFAKGRRVLPLVCSALCYFGVLVTLGCLVLRERRWPVANRWAAIFLAAALMGWKGNAFVLAEPFLLQWTLSQFAVILSLALLAAVPARGSRFLAGSISAAVVATYSSGNGMLVWPILIAAGLVSKLRRREMAVLIASGILAVGLYCVGYKSSSRLNLSNFFLHPLYSLEFLGAYMSMPFGGMKGPHFGAYLGLSCIVIAVLLCAVAVRKRFIRTSPIIVLFGSYAFVLLTAALTGAGRMDITDPHYAGAEATRYLTLPLMSWAVFILACIWASTQSRTRILGPWTVITVFTVLLLVGLPKLRWWLKVNERPFVQRQVTSLAIENGITDNNLLAMIFPDPWFVRRSLPEVRAAHISIFSNGKPEWVGKQLDSVGPVKGQSQDGRLTYSYPVENGLELAGFVRRQGDSSRRILLANDNGTIVGFGKSLLAGFPSAIPTPSPSGGNNWIGFANLSYPSKSISAYAMTPAGLMLLGTAAVPAERVVSPANIGGPVGSISWRTEGAPASSRIPKMPLGNPPGPIYSTWANGDAEQATIQSAVFDVPRNGCLILPVLAGPSTESLSVSVLDSKTGAILTRLPMQNESAGWTYWQIPIASTMTGVRIVAQDRGSGFGQWLAVAGPRQCR